MSSSSAGEKIVHISTKHNADDRHPLSTIVFRIRGRSIKKATSRYTILLPETLALMFCENGSAYARTVNIRKLIWKQ